MSNDYSKNALEEFKSLVQFPDQEVPYRIISPIHSDDFNKNGKYGNYFQDYIDKMWIQYTSTELKLQMDQGTFTGKVENDIFTFTSDKSNVKYTIEHPDSWEVFFCKGKLQKPNPNPAFGGDDNRIQLAIQAQFCAMFNRHMLEEPENRCILENFYQTPPYNYYAKFWHPNSIDNKAYGFPFDDVCGQSTLLVDPQPQELKIHIRWD